MLCPLSPSIYAQGESCSLMHRKCRLYNYCHGTLIQIPASTASSQVRFSVTCPAKSRYYAGMQAAGRPLDKQQTLPAAAVPAVSTTRQQLSLPSPQAAAATTATVIATAQYNSFTIACTCCLQLPAALLGRCCCCRCCCACLFGDQEKPVSLSMSVPPLLLQLLVLVVFSLGTIYLVLVSTLGLPEGASTVRVLLARCQVTP
jgi:hypothetical protein